MTSRSSARDPVGATLALAVADADLDIVVLDARAAGETPRGERTLALSHGARLIFERLGVWSALAAIRGAVTPIVAIDISQAGGFGMTRLDARENDLPALGYVVSYRALQAALDAALARAGDSVRHGVAVTAVGGTSAYAAVECAGAGQPMLARGLPRSPTARALRWPACARQRHDYGQVAARRQGLASNVAQDGIAYERFTPEGPIALLPQEDHYGLVWTVTPAARGSAAGASRLRVSGAARTDFAPRVERIHPRRRPGARFRSCSNTRPRRSAPRCVVLGNAAQTLHPVAGQGFNLGLRDAFELAQAILDAPRDSAGRCSRCCCATHAAGARDRCGGHRIHARTCQLIRQ